MGLPPFALDADEMMNMDFGFEEEDFSLVKPSDVDLYEHGVTPPYRDKSLILSGYNAKADSLGKQQLLAENNAMSYLMQALNKQAEISPEQGLATALLAAIPTFGGYMIGKSVGSPELPAGYFEAGGTRAAIGLDKMGDPASEGGLAGAAAGAKSAQGYIGALEADKAQKNDIYQKMAAIESNRASRLETRAEQYNLAGLNQEQYNQRQREALAARGQGSGRPTQFDMMSPDQQQAYLSKQAGVDAQGTPIADPFLKDRVLTPSGRVFEKAAAADSLPILQERVRGLYNKAIEQIGPGFLEAYARKGMAAFPANIQQEFMSTLNAMAMEMNRAVDPTPSEGGRLAQLELLQGSIANGSFLDLLDFKVKSARQAALNELRPFTLGNNANSQAVAAYQTYEKGWGLGSNPAEGSMPPPDLASQIAELKAKIAAEKARLGVK